ncbi:ribosome maturation factor RimM [bacterium]|nr:ribosome maturation factor RimM [bacterium]
MADPLLPPPERRLYVGRIVKVRGLRGDLKVVPLTWNPDRFQDIEGIWVKPKAAEASYFTFKRVRMEQNTLFFRFHEVPNRETAEPLAGAELFLDMDERIDLPDGYYYHDDLIGCAVECKTHGHVGVVTSVSDESYPELLVVKKDDREVLVPMIEYFVKEVEYSTRKVLVDLPEGYLEV